MPEDRQRFDLPWIGRTAALAVAYLIAGKAGLLMAIPPGFATAVWPPSGIALGCLLIFGLRHWPGIVIGSFLVNITVSATGTATEFTLSQFTVPISIGGGAALQAVFGAVLIRRYVNSPDRISEHGDVYKLLTLGAPVACVVSATWGTVTLLADQVIAPDAFVATWWTWWVGDSIGVLIFLPLMLIAFAEPRDLWRRRTRSVGLPLVLAFGISVTLFHAASVHVWAVLAGATLFTGLLGAYLLVVSGRTEAVEAMLAAKDGELLAQSLGQESTREALKESRDALSAVEDRFLDLIEGMSDGAAIFDKNGCLITCNSEYHSFVKSVAEDILKPGMHFEDFVRRMVERDFYENLPEDREGWIRKRMAKFYAGGSVSEHQHATGRTFRVHDYKTREGGTLIILTNITEQKRVEAAMRESAANLRAIMDNAPMEIYLKDAEGRYLQINKRFEELWDVTDEDMRGKFPMDAHDPSLAAPTRAHDLAVLRENRIISQIDETEIHGERRVLKAVKFPIHDPVGNVAGIGAITTDVTDQHNAEEALRSSEAKLKTALDETERQVAKRTRELAESRSQLMAVIDNSPAEIVLKDRELRYLLVNKTFTEHHGPTLEEVLGTTAADIFDADFAAEIHAQDMKTLNLGGMTERQYEREIDGEVRSELEIKFPIRGADGDIWGIGGIITDITDLKTTQAQLVHADKLATLGRMAAGITHELAQPLNIIRLSTQVGLMDANEEAADDEIMDSLKTIDGQVTRMAEIIDHMRIFARRDDDTAQYFSPTECVDGSLAFMRQQFAPLGITLAEHLPETSRRVRGSPGQLEQVLVNVLANAGDAVLEKMTKAVEADKTFHGRIDVKVAESHADDRIVISVTDNGGGIPEDVLAHIFDPFYTTKEVGSGTGLGLSVSYSIIDAMGGVLSVQNVDSGAEFNIILPAVEHEDAQGSSAGANRDWVESEPFERGSAQGMTLLVAEDEEIANQLLSIQLRNAGYEVITALNGADALKAYEEADNIDALVTDLQMPVMGGEELIVRIREVAPDLPIIVTTGKMNLEDDKEVVPQEANYVFRKPIDLREILRVLKELTGGDDEPRN